MNPARTPCGAASLLGLAALLTGAQPAGAHTVPQGIERARDRTPAAPDVAQDIEALAQFHGPGKKAAARLAERGATILPELHAAMLDPDADPRKRMQLAVVVGQIGDASSVGPLVALARAAADQGGVRQAALDMLCELPVAPDAVELADELLGDAAESWRVRRKALVYLGRQRVEAARHWVEVYRADPEIELRAAALYVAARLGDGEALGPLVELLALPAPPALRYALMLGIAELNDADGFRRATPDWIRGSWEYRSALRWAEFRTAGEARRAELVRTMIASEALFERQEAARWLLEARGPQALAELAAEGIPPHVRAVARHRLRRAGFRVLTAEDGGVTLEREERP